MKRKELLDRRCDSGKVLDPCACLLSLPQVVVMTFFHPDHHTLASKSTNRIQIIDLFFFFSWSTVYSPPSLNDEGSSPLSTTPQLTSAQGQQEQDFDQDGENDEDEFETDQFGYAHIHQPHHLFSQ